MLQSSENRNNEVVQVNLSVRQCALVLSLIDAELSSADTGASFFRENALKAVFDVFYDKTRKSAAEEHQAIEKWVNKIYHQRNNEAAPVTLPRTADASAVDDSGDWHGAQALGVNYG